MTRVMQVKDYSCHLLVYPVLISNTFLICCNKRRSHICHIYCWIYSVCKWVVLPGPPLHYVNLVMEKQRIKVLIVKFKYFKIRTINSTLT